MHFFLNFTLTVLGLLSDRLETQPKLLRMIKLPFGSFFYSFPQAGQILSLLPEQPELIESSKVCRTLTKEWLVYIHYYPEFTFGGRPIPLRVLKLPLQDYKRLEMDYSPSANRIGHQPSTISNSTTTCVLLVIGQINANQVASAIVFSDYPHD